MRNDAGFSNSRRSATLTGVSLASKLSVLGTIGHVAVLLRDSAPKICEDCRADAGRRCLVLQLRMIMVAAARDEEQHARSPIAVQANECCRVTMV